jgi:hypothetical protein
MNRCLRLGLAAGLGALLAGCGAIDPINGPSRQSGSADFRVYVAMGTSLGAGYESGGLVQRHQVHSYAYLFAQQAGATSFTIPSISDSGLGPLLVLRSYNPLLITPASTPGSPTNFTQPTSYHNMSVPGAVLVDVLDSTAVGYNRGLFPIIQRGRGLIIQQALGLGPTFISFEYGANEVLGPGTQGSGTSPFPPATFAALYTAAMNAIAAGAPSAKLALFNVPDVTSIPFFTTFPAFTVSLTTGNPVPLVGAGGPLALGDLVLLTAGSLIAQGYGIPSGGYNYVNPAAGSNGQPLPEDKILRASEVTELQSTVTAYNGIIDSVASRRNAALVDLNGLLRQASTSGIRYGSVVYTSDFVTGGIFSLDGVHPTDLGYAFMANRMIDAVNAKFGATIPRVDLGAVATRGRYALRPANGGSTTKPLVSGLDGVLRDLYGVGGMTNP